MSDLEIVNVALIAQIKTLNKKIEEFYLKSDRDVQSWLVLYKLMQDTGCAQTVVTEFDQRYAKGEIPKFMIREFGDVFGCDGYDTPNYDKDHWDKA